MISRGPKNQECRIFPGRVNGTLSERIFRMKAAFSVLLFFLVMSDGSAFDGGKPAERLIGGPCEYHRYKGKAEIVSVRPKRMPGNGAPSYETFEVLFSFQSEEEIEESWVRVEGRLHLLTLANGWYPGLEFLRRYRIETGQDFDCHLKVITKGACTPMLFDFPDIDVADYSEHVR